MKRFFIFSILSLFTVTACGPQYTFIPPKTEKERECANNCIKERGHCVYQCKQKAILTDAMYTSDSTFHFNHMYTSKNSCKVIKNSDEVRENSDREKCLKQCDIGQKLCHENCGGKVL